MEKSPQTDPFREYFHEARPILVKEPLAETLGAFTQSDAAIEFSFIDVVKAAGHACPTVTGAFLCCQAALDFLYGNEEVPVRGEIAVTVYGEPTESALGVMAQVFTVITGAAPATGFKGLGPSFKRQDLLRFDPEKRDQEAVCIRFERLDTGRAALVRFYPWLVSFSEEKAERLAAAMQLVVSGRADEKTRGEFQDLWSEKIRGMIVDRKDIDEWLKLEED